MYDFSDLPVCACGCRAWHHVEDKDPPFVKQTDAEVTRVYKLRKCTKCPCEGYTVSVETPRMSAKIEGT